MFFSIIRTVFFSILRTKYYVVVFQKWYFITKIVLIYCEKKCSSDEEKLLKIKAEGREFPKITITIYSNSERSEQFVVTEWFSNLFNKLGQLEFKLEKNYWDLETGRKS